MILSLLGSTRSGSGGGRETPCSGMSSEAREPEDPPVNQPKKPGEEEEEEEVVATALELA